LTVHPNRPVRNIFQAYVRGIVNGKGFVIVEPETRDYKRMDLEILFGAEKFIVEVKLWRGDSNEKAGLEQLAGYLDAENEEKGYLLTFGLGKAPRYEPGWADCNGKRIFKVMV
jgi:hypothetical protein